MASRYKFSDEEIKAIEQARRDNKDKRAEARLKALELRAKGATASKVGEATGFHNSQIYFVLHRHGWRKVMPCSKHPKKASDEEIAASKKLMIQSES